MPMVYQRELDFTLSLLKRLRMPVHLVDAGVALSSYDGGLRSLIGMETDYESAARMGVHWSRERTVYKVLDQFRCHYVYFQLPRREKPTYVLLGPYLTEDPSSADLLEMAEGLGLSLSIMPQLADYYAALPVYHDPSAIIAVVSTLGESLWGSRGFDMVDINHDQLVSLPAAVSVASPIEQENILQRMQQMEERYGYENELMEIVSKGLTDRAEVIMSSVSSLNYQMRAADPLRNQKNYCIICNTLLRKAAQQGGVHPIHLDRMSGQFARAIENAATIEKCSTLIGEMIRAYCRLVRTRARNQYSVIIQKVMTYIDANLSGDLSLAALAGLLQVSPSYLSALFHRETGRTLASHIAETRMKAALQLLRTTQLQVQTIALLTGFSDPNYFGKRFRQFYGVTPLQYRYDQRRSSTREEHP